jgi:hypothetical protein
MEAIHQEVKPQNPIQKMYEEGVRARVKALMARGYFILASKIHKAYSEDKGIIEDGISLKNWEVARIAPEACPCGDCDYYVVELFPDERRWIAHHNSEGIFREGYY